MPSEVMVSTDEKAQELARQGFYVFPSENKKKHINGWPTEATRDPEKIKKWFGPGGTHESWKISIFTGKFGDDEALVVVDIDPRNGGDETIRAIEAQHPEAFPPTREHRTPNGGLHKLYRTKGPGLKSVAHAYGQGVDAKSAGGLVHFGDGYELIHDPPVAEVSQYLLAQSESVGSTSRPHPRAQALPSVIINQEHAEARAIWYLEHDALPAIQGQGGDQTTFAVAARIKDFGVPEQAATMLMWEHWNDRCEPRWEPGDLETKVQNAYKYSQNPFGVDAPNFPPVEPGDTPAPDYFAEVKKNNTLVGDHVIEETFDAEGHETLDHISVQDFKTRHNNHRTMVNGKPVPVGTAFLEDPDRPTCESPVFMPERHEKIIRIEHNGRTKNYFNLWRGFAVAPAPVGASHVALTLFLEHLRLNVCGGDEALFRWLLGYLAHMIQKPGEKPEVALVFRGGKGVGKTIVFLIMGMLLGRHYLSASNRRHLLGNFNGHLENLVLFVLDEAVWAGDKGAEGILKDLITGTSILIEHKGVAVHAIRNNTRVAILGNESWLIPASGDERRFAFFDVGAGRKQDREFFGAMLDGMRNDGGSAVLLRYLMTYDFSGIDVNVAPKTPGLLSQKLESGDPLDQWWHDCLFAGRIMGSEFEGWPVQIDCERFLAAFRRGVKARNIHTRELAESVRGRRLSVWGVKQFRKRQGDAFIRLYDIPAIAEARRCWEQYTSQTEDWGSDS